MRRPPVEPKCLGLSVVDRVAACRKVALSHSMEEEHSLENEGHASYSKPLSFEKTRPKRYSLGCELIG
jgi:hypothetical protein